MNLVATRAGHQARRVIRAGLRDVCKHRAHPLRIRTSGFGCLLRTPKLRRGDHFHRLGDLLRRLNGGDPVFQILK